MSFQSSVISCVHEQPKNMAGNDCGKPTIKVDRFPGVSPWLFHIYWFTGGYKKLAYRCGFYKWITIIDN